MCLRNIKSCKEVNVQVFKSGGNDYIQSYLTKYDLGHIIRNKSIYMINRIVTSKTTSAGVFQNRELEKGGGRLDI